MGLEAQRDRVKEFAKTKGLDLIDVIQEAASGGVQNGEEHSWEHRPVLLELMDRAVAGGFDVLLVAKLDRLSRDYATLTVLERRLQKHGVDVVSVAEQNGDGALAEFIRGQLALVAQLERAMILMRARQEAATGPSAHRRRATACAAGRGISTRARRRARAAAEAAALVGLSGQRVL